MTVEQACELPIGTIVTRMFGQSDLDALGEAGFFPIRQHGQRITLQRVSGRLCRLDQFGYRQR